MRWQDCRPTLKLTTAPTTEPVTVAELGLQSRIDEVVENPLFDSYIKAAREMVETDLSRALITQTWSLKLDAFPDDAIQIRRCPLISVSSIAYLDTNGASQTLSSSVYVVNNHGEPGLVTLAYGQTWPTTYDQNGAVTITFTAGYGSYPVSVPERAKQAIRLLAAHWIENREDSVQGPSVKSIPMGYESLVDRLRWAGYR